jgi:hypothetical protein
MPLVDRWAGLLDGPVIAGTSTQGAWFDGDDTTVGIMLGTSGTPNSFVIDALTDVAVDIFRISWSFGTMHPGFGAAAGFAIDTGSSATGPWTEILADADPHLTAGVSYPQDFELEYELAATETSRYWRVRATEPGNNDIFTINAWEDVPDDPDDPPVDPGFTPPEPARAILEIYVHDEDASRWGTATWATGPATGTEGIWSGAGWQDVTPEGLNAHITWGARRPERGILADQDTASWRVQTYDPDRVLDPGNADSPFYPQLVAGVPIRISHDGMVIRTGYIDRLTFAHKAPDYRGEILATDTIALLAKARVPDASVLDDTLYDRISDAINAAGIAVGGIPIPGGLTGGPSLSAEPTGDNSVWDHVTAAAREVLWVPFIDAAGGLQLRSWGAPLDRGREVTDEHLEDLQSFVSEDGTYSAVLVNDATGSSTIDRVVAPLPRYGRRYYERTETTTDPEGWADAVLADRAWPGVQYVPGTIHCFTAADVDHFGSLEVMERLRITVAGAVSVTGRILGGELWAENKHGRPGATWMFRFQIATDGSSAIGLTTLVADGTGEVLLDDATETDYLEAD